MTDKETVPLFRDEYRYERVKARYGCALSAAIPTAIATEVVPFAHFELRKKTIATVTAEKKPKRYDIGTGVVYAPEVEDVLVPALIRICPFYEGCLESGQSVFTEERKLRAFGRSFSVDLGFGAGTIDETRDPRRNMQIAFMAGGSFMPISYAALGGGALIFENQQSGNWNATPYIGLTVDLRDAIEALEKLRGVEVKVLGEDEGEKKKE